MWNVHPNTVVKRDGDTAVAKKKGKNVVQFLGGGKKIRSILT